jgi:hypothetical protein
MPSCPQKLTVMPQQSLSPGCPQKLAIMPQRSSGLGCPKKTSRYPPMVIRGKLSNNMLDTWSNLETHIRLPTRYSRAWPHGPTSFVIARVTSEKWS